MKGKSKRSFWKHTISLALTFGLCVSGIGSMPVGNVNAQAADVISIESAADLQKIGNDAAYPLSGDYRLTQDIDLAGVDFTPIGGGVGVQGSYQGANVFSGTFDGAGHTISNLRIQKDGSASSAWQYGLFGIVSGADESDKASVSNLILADVDIRVDMKTDAESKDYLSLGGLAGEVNRNAEINNIAVVGGAVAGNPSNGGDVVGAGGLIGEMRPDNVQGNDSGVTVTNIFVSADVTSGSSTQSNYVGGIIGRIAKKAPAEVSACLFTGTASFKGMEGYGIHGGDQFETVRNCYYISGRSLSETQVTQVSDEELKSGTLPVGMDENYWTAEKGSGVNLTQCADSEKFQEILALSALKPVFAAGDDSSSVTGNFTVPMQIEIGGGKETVEWSSDRSGILAFGADGTVTVTPPAFLDVICTVTALTSSGKTKQFTITVKSSENPVLKIEQAYATIDQPLTAAVDGLPEGMTAQYVWSIDGKSDHTGDSYTPTADDLEKMLTVKADILDDGQNRISSLEPVSMYISKLPVIYINTEDGTGVTSKDVYKDAVMRIQGNERFQGKTLYDGVIEIRGRGNTTWDWAWQRGGKLPYKIKLGKKTSLLGFGENKHWALLANYMEESLLRNKTSYDLAGELGVSPHLPSANVDLIFNGTYAGNYQLVGNVRIHESRVNIFNWEDCAEDAAEALAPAIAEDNPDASVKDIQKYLEDALNENMDWITSDRAAYAPGGNRTYRVSDYYTGIPRNENGGVDVSGGFLYELDSHYDEASKFRTKFGQPMMFKAPEFVAANSELFGYAKKYIQAVEDSVHAADFYVNIAREGDSGRNSEFTEDFEGRRHYTDLVDMDSLVSYLLLNEFYWNTETMKKSSFMYKDVGRGNKMYIGPVWDMDWTSGSKVSAGQTDNPEVWMVLNAAEGAQAESWYRYLIGDPYFVEKLYECYWENREKLYDIVKEGGILDQERAYMQESGDANYNLPNSLYDQCREDFTTSVERLKTFLTQRLSWMDAQFGYTDSETPDAVSSKAALDFLLASFGAFKDDTALLSVTVDVSGEKDTTYTAAVKDAGIQKVGFYINGILAGTQTVENGTASLTVNDGTAGLVKNTEHKPYVNNIVQVRAMNGDNVTGSSNYVLFQKEIAADPLTGTVEIQGIPRVGCTLRAAVSDTNNSGKLSYQWKADNVPIERATQESYVLTDAEEGKVISVEVTSSWETGRIEPAAPTEAVIKVVVLNDHIIINQVYGGGANEDSAASHSFIELYNPTDQDVSLSGYTLSCFSQGKNGATGAEGAVLNLDAKTIPSGHSYLIRCEAQTLLNNKEFYLTIADDGYDQAWTQTIDNKRYKIILYTKDGQIADGVSVQEGNIEQEGEQVPADVISKQKSIRRTDFKDTNNNAADFTQVDYRSADVKQMRPRCLADGAWGEEEPAPLPTELKGTVSIRGNAVAGVHLYADIALDETGYIGDVICKWKADGAEIKGASGRFLQADESFEGKTISVEVTSADETITGTLKASMPFAIKTVEAQRSHVIINQIYGDGGKKEVPLSHSFIELYNPTNAEVDLSGYSIRYQSGTINGELSLSGKILPGHSYLIRCKAAKSTAGAVSVSEGDMEWADQTIDNKRYRVTLQNGTEQIDGVSVNEEPAEGTPLTDPDPANDDTVISKNKAIRRINFADTDQNADDFEVLNYTNLKEWNLTEMITDIQPRSGADGAWGLKIKDEPVEPDQAIMKEAEDAKKEAERLQADKSKYTADSYRKMEDAYEALLRALESKDENLIRQATQDLKQAMAGLKKTEELQVNNKQTSLAGTQFLYKKGWYVITKDSGTEYTVTYVRPEKKTLKSVKIPAAVSKDGVSYRVTAIADKAFAKNKKLKSVTIGKYVETIGKSAFAGDGKLKKIILQTTVLKTVGAKALKGVHAQCRIKAPKKQYKLYAKKFKKKGQKSTVRIVK